MKTKKDIEVSNLDLQKFAIILSGIIICIFTLYPYFFQNKLFNYVPLVASLVLILLSFLKPTYVKFIYKIWMLIGSKLGYINTRLLLFLFFYLVFCPMGLMKKYFLKDQIEKKPNLKVKTYRSEVEYMDLSDYRRQF